MTRLKIESESAATSTIAVEPLPIHCTGLYRKLIVLAIFGAGVAWLAGPAGRLLVVLPLLLFGPGYLAERAVLQVPHSSAFLRPAVWLGLSLSIVVLIYEWTTAFGLALSAPALALLAAACALGLIWQLWAAARTGIQLNAPTPTGDQRLGERFRWSAASGWWSIALLAIFALTLWTRFFQIRDLVLPNWVDSIHHALLIRVAAERGQAPLSLRPYMPVDQIPYHWGYHVFVATAMRLAGLALPETMLWTGQVLNALHVLAVAALAAYLWRRPLAGVVAALVVGLLSIFPAYYVSWGRYTQLTGLLLLPPLIAVWLELLRAPARRLAIVLALLLAGLSLIHFIVLVFALCFMAASGIAWAVGARRAAIRSGLLYLAGSGMLALALAGPWLWGLGARALLRLGNGQAKPLAVVGGDYFALDPSLLWAGHNRLLIGFALLAALWGVRKRVHVVVVQLIWLAALFVLANPWLVLLVLPLAGVMLLVWGLARRRRLLVLVGAAMLLPNPLLIDSLPYLALINTESVLISLFLPIGVLLGGGATMVWEWLERWRRMGQQDDRPTAHARRWWLSAARVASMLALGGLALAGAWDLRDVVNRRTVLATPADIAALAWAAEHTPQDARFLINATPWLATGRGADGGWWLLPLAGRWTSTPAVLYDYGQAEYVRETRARTQQVIDFRAGQEQAIYQLIDRDQIGYIYLGPNSKPLTTAAFPINAGFEKIYERDGVTIFAVHR
jgi:hypothetical protein